MKIYSLFFFFVFLSCNKDLLYTHEIYIEKQNWAYSQTLEFTWPVTDTHKLYNVTLFVNHTPSLPYQNLYIKCLTTYPDLQNQEQVLSLELLSPSGKPNGQCRFGKCVSEIPLQERIQFPIMGKYSLQLLQHSRDSLYSGIDKIKLEIKESPISQ